MGRTAVDILFAPRVPLTAVTLLGAMLRAPTLTGAVAPSSRFLARAMAREAAGAGHIIELGAGTGPVTRALAQQHPRARLTVVELQPFLAKKLAADFPEAQVIARPAAAVLDEAATLAEPYAVVSSLPFRSLPQAVRRQTCDSLHRFLSRNPGSWLVQFTYQPRAPFEAPPGFVWARASFVAANLPPAGVWVLRQAR